MKRSIVFGSAAIALVASVGMAQSVTIDNGVVGDGHLRIDIDGYGGYTNWGWATNLDYYDPAGAYTEGSPMFAASFMLYSGGVDKVAFGEPFFDIDNSYNLREGTFDLPSASNPIVNGAGTEASSSWSSANFAGDMSFDFVLVQTVADEGAGVASLTQVMTITNTAATAVDFDLQRHLDIDSMFNGSYEDVAGSVNCDGVDSPYQRSSDGDRNSPSTIALMSPDTTAFVAMKSGYDNGGGTAMAYGTDYQTWDNFGYPTGWRNYTAGVGVAPIVGELPGAQPAGSVAPYDAAINIQWSLSLAPGESTTITAITLYGEDCLSGGCVCACNVDTSTGLDVCDIFDFLGFQNAFVGGESCACNIDTSTGTDVCDIFDFLAFQNEFVTGCP